MTNMPNKGDPQTPQIDPITVMIGVEKLLAGLNSRTLTKGKVPKAWRTVKIVAIYKKGDKSCAANYCPVSLTSVPCNILEHITFRHIMNHCEQDNLLVNFQHGFKIGPSCENQLITTLEDIFKAKNDGKNVDMLIIDFSAFDTVQHNRLNHKLEHYGISGQVGHWVPRPGSQIQFDHA